MTLFYIVLAMLIGGVLSVVVAATMTFSVLGWLTFGALSCVAQSSQKRQFQQRFGHN